MSLTVSLLAALALSMGGPSGDDDLPPAFTVVSKAVHAQRTDVVLRYKGSLPIAERDAEACYRWAYAHAVSHGTVRILVERAGRPADAKRPPMPIERWIETITPPPRKPFESDVAIQRPHPGGTAQVTSQAHAGSAFAFTGALSGKTVYLSPSHGWFHDPGDQRWETQRPITHQIVEDFLSTDVIESFVAPNLERAGAKVWVLRERDHRTTMVILDDADGASSPHGSYVESGAALFQPSTARGWGRQPLPLSGSANPFTAGSRVVRCLPGPATAEASWTLAVPSDGSYALYVSFASGSNRVRDAHYRIRHAGGEVDLRIDQTIDGYTWRYLGTFRFRQGTDPARGSIALLNDTQDVGVLYASLDAVRIGGGMGEIDRGNGVTGRPRHEECARYYTQWIGAPSSVYMARTTDRDSDVVARSRYAAWENETGEDAVYFAWHTNAPDPARGTSSYIYSTNPTSGSVELQRAIHDELIRDIRAGYDPAWQDRGKLSAAFGEVNPSHNPETPAVLFEIAFHDTQADAEVLRDPKFLRLAGRSITQGIIRYFADRDGYQAHFPPDAPRNLRTTWMALGVVQVSWDAPATTPAGLGGDPPTSYRLHLGDGTRDLGHAIDVGSSTSFLLTGLDPTRAYTLALSASNLGGESPLSETLAVQAGLPGAPRVLLVHAFEREDRYNLPDTFEQTAGTVPVVPGPNPTALVSRYFPERVNTFDYAVEHADALAHYTNLRVDAASRGAVRTGAVHLPDFDLVVWMAGEEAEATTTDNADSTSFGVADRAAVQSYLAQGGRLFVSGAEIAWDLDRDGDPNDPESVFVRQWLHAAYVRDDTATFSVQARAGTPFAPLGPFLFDDGTGPGYEVEFPDGLTTSAGSSPILDYVGGTGGIAGLAYDGAHRVVYLGFPFESIVDPATRRTLLRRALDRLLR